MAALVLKSHFIYSFRYLNINCLSLFVNRISYYSTLETNKSNDYEENQPIIIPKRIERGPTDILRALANTVKKDFSGPAYKYSDDPYLTPVSNLSKRSYALAKDSGRKAAKYFFDKYPEMFFRDNAEPKIEAFSYKDIYDENTSVDEIDLQKCIIRSEVKNSIVCYNNVKNEGKDISSKTLHELLELISFYNCEEPPDLEDLGEKWFKSHENDRRMSWKDNDLVEQIFNSIEDKTSQTYCAIILGMIKHLQTEKAYFLYEQMLEKNLSPNVEVFNGLIRITAYLRDSSESRWLLIEELLNRMNSYKIRPNLETLNTVLEQFNRMGSWKSAKHLALKTIVEMVVKLRINPSLATYYHLLNIFCKEKGPQSPILYEIMDEIEGQDFTARDVKDVAFFVRAMSVCQLYLSDVQLAYRIHRFLNKGNHCKLIGDSLNETNYYQRFFRLLCTAENIDTFMTIYNKYVPHVYTPDPSVMSEIIEMINLYDAFHYIPQIWSDLILFELMNKLSIIEQILGVMAKTKVEQTLQKQFAEIAWDGIKRIDKRIENNAKHNIIQPVEWTANALEYCLTIFLNSDDIHKAYEVIKKLDSQENSIVGYPGSDCLLNFCNSAIDQKRYAFALHCIRYCNQINKSEIGVSVMKYIETLDLEEKIKSAFEKLCQINETKLENNFEE